MNSADPEINGQGSAISPLHVGHQAVCYKLDMILAPDGLALISVTLAWLRRSSTLPYRAQYNGNVELNDCNRVWIAEFGVLLRTR